MLVTLQLPGLIPRLSLSLAHHTPNPRERGSGDRAYNKLFWRQDLVASNQIQDLNLLLSNAFLAARAYTVRPALFAVTHDVSCNYCIPPEQLAVRMVTRSSFS
jgi:hypothetical protein